MDTQERKETLLVESKRIEELRRNYKGTHNGQKRGKTFATAAPPRDRTISRAQRKANKA